MKKDILEAIRGQFGTASSFSFDPVARHIQGARGISVPGPKLFDLRAAILTAWNDLLRCGVIAFGNLDGQRDWAADTFHLSGTGRKALERFDSDPCNPDGYMNHLKNLTTLPPIGESYIHEALNTYNAGCHKTTAVLVGTAAEDLLLGLRGVLVDRYTETNRPIPEKIKTEWQSKRISDWLEAEFDKHRGEMPAELGRRYDMYWAGFTAHIRAIRNAAGHPNSIDPVTPECVHAELLIFPEFGRLVNDLAAWVKKRPL